VLLFGVGVVADCGVVADVVPPARNVGRFGVDLVRAPTRLYASVEYGVSATSFVSGRVCLHGVRSSLVWCRACAGGASRCSGAGCGAFRCSWCVLGGGSVDVGIRWIGGVLTTKVEIWIVSILVCG
jgi:hypothetical protein